MRDQKRNRWCLDCGYIGPPEAMDFDHRPGETKAMAVSAGGRGSVSLRRLAQEILKCDLVCANCHRIRTYQRRQKELV